MADYLREILKPTIDAFGDAIMDEEAGGSEFVRSTLTWFESRFTNLVLFKELPAGTLPPRAVQVLKYGSAPPANGALIWSGAIISNGTNGAVSVFR